MALVGTALTLSILYLAALFAVASFGDRRAGQGRSVIANPYVYTLSLAVYCTAWTFFGSVGLAATGGLAFMPVYLGPTLAALLFAFVLRKILLITKAYGITSIADFISARYGKSGLLAGLVTIVAVVGTVPYMSIQLNAVAASLELMLVHSPNAAFMTGADSALLVALLLAVFSILFGTRHIDATEHHQGMVLAVAVESIVKLLCFVTLGVVVTFWLFDGPGAILEGLREAGRGDLLTLAGTGYGNADWILLTALSALAMLVLPRQFQVAVIENVELPHVRRSIWLFPLYLFAINLFVLPIALAGVASALGGSPDSIVVALPLAAGHDWLALVAYLGGFSAATAMVIVETVALSTMVSNDLVMPVLLRIKALRLERWHDLSRLILMVRRVAILLVLLLGYVFFQLIGNRYGLASIGLIAFCAMAQLAPLIIAGIYWREAALPGAVLGLAAGFAVWIYTLIVPAMAGTGTLSITLVTEGPAGIGLLRPTALFGLSGLHPVSHALVWSLTANVGLLVLVSLLVRQNKLERLQALLFVDVESSRASTRLWRGEAQVGALLDLLRRFLGPERAEAVLASDAAARGRALARDEAADAALVQLSERGLARALGAASARVVVGSVVRGEVMGPDELMEILDETQKVLEYSHRLEEKSLALEEATGELRRANERLQQLDRLKDDFIATVSHELRTPLTSIRSFSEILHDTPDLEPAERQHFLHIVIRESERLTRLINDVLDLSKIESGRMEWHVGPCDLRDTVQEAVAASEGLMAEKKARLECELEAGASVVVCDRDRLLQVLINLLSNASKFLPAEDGRVRLIMRRHRDRFEVRVEDNGPGVPPAYREAVFEKFRQVSDDLKSRPKGTGLGLPISRHIIEHFGGRIWVEDAALGGAALCFTLPVPRADHPALAAE
ncbi:sensor histidine kinase [Marinimicrococcus flavescens]|uniref:histidine kinase n=1 Tax=Marinimicrococcus flavescens TaxID=3031815 RepID=A0AAP3XTL2_9PROT|nr:sensor histidine kinase [Marinimicrococcus flavescens]